VSQLLPDLDVQRALGKLPGWGRKGTALSKTYRFATFRAGIDFVNTHDAGGITQKDLNLASELDQLATDALG
jgi:pterin-4a-carbinolamine dehydratase